MYFPGNKPYEGMRSGLEESVTVFPPDEPVLAYDEYRVVVHTTKGPSHNSYAKSPLGTSKRSQGCYRPVSRQNRSGPHQMSPIVMSHPPSRDFPPYQGYKMPQHPGSSSVFGLTPIQIDHPEDQDHSLRLYGLPSSLRESTFVAKNLRIHFLLTTVVGPYPDSIASEFYCCAEPPLS